MTIVLLALPFAAAVSPASVVADPPNFVASRLAFDADLRSYEVLDVDGDELADLLIVTHDGKERRLRLHRQRADSSFAADPDWAQAIPSEVVAFGILECRKEPGKELLLFTPGGILSASFTKSGLSGNARVELRQPVFPEIAEPDRLDLWPWILDLDFDGDDDLVLPEPEKVACFMVATDAQGETRLVRAGELPSRYDSGERLALPREFAEDDDEADEKRRYDRRALRLFDGVSSSLPRLTRTPLLERRRRWDLPRLGFWNGDERPDALVVTKNELRIELQRDGLGFESLPAVPLPPLDKDKERTVELVNFEDDDSDLQSELVRITNDDSGLEKDYEVVVTAIGSDGLPAPDARAVLLIRASDAEFSFRDADGDGRKDVVVVTTQLPSGISSLASVRVDVALEVYRGQPDGSFSRRADAKYVRSFTPEKLSRLAEAQIFHLSGDYDGDGKEDIVLMDESGRLRIHRLLADGGGLKFDSESMLPPYAPPEPVLSCWSFDFNPDAISDLCLRFEKGLLVFVSRKEAGQ